MNRWCPKHGGEYPCKDCDKEAREEAATRELVNQGRQAALNASALPEKKKVRADRAPFVLEALLKTMDDGQIADFVSIRVNMTPREQGFDPAYAELRAALDDVTGTVPQRLTRELPPAAAALLARREALRKSQPVPSGDLRNRLLEALTKLSDGSFDKIRAEIGNTPRRAKRTG